MPIGNVNSTRVSDRLVCERQQIEQQKMIACNLIDEPTIQETREEPEGAT
jgi:hypothetical protein